MSYRITHTYEVDVPNEMAANDKAYDVSSFLETVGAQRISAHVRWVPTPEDVLDSVGNIIQHDRLEPGEKCVRIEQVVRRLTDPVRG